MVVVLLAEGFEEIEALTQVNFLRRAGIAVQTVAVAGASASVRGSHGIRVQADARITGYALPEEAEMLLLPGGSAGVEVLAQSAETAALLRQAHGRGLWLAAICAAPTVLAAQGYLHGCRATCYPGCEAQFPADTAYTGAAVECVPSAKIVTARSAGVSGSFAVALVQALRGPEAAKRLKASLYADW